MFLHPALAFNKKQAEGIFHLLILEKLSSPFYTAYIAVNVCGLNL